VRRLSEELRTYRKRAAAQARVPGQVRELTAVIGTADTEKQAEIMPGRSSFVKTRCADTRQTADDGGIPLTIDLNFLQFRYIVRGNGPAAGNGIILPRRFFWGVYSVAGATASSKERLTDKRKNLRRGVGMDATKVKHGDLVCVFYEGLLHNGEVFESSDDTGPLEFQIGDNSVLPGFENAIIGMNVGEEKTIQLQPEEAYGLKQDELIHVVDRKSLSKDIAPQTGMVLGLTIERQGQKHKVPAMITKVDGDAITVDFNHPLAGQVLTYKITLKEIRQPSQSD
jgi:peptidylprolyl isomerase